MELCHVGLEGFGWVDYVILISIILATLGIGLFYSISGPKSTTSQDFLLGSSNMGTFPMALSLCTGFVTAIELLGNPAEVYYHGTQYAMVCFSILMVTPVTAYIYLPVFMELRLTSVYQYLELRFNRFTRVVAAGFYVLQMTLYTSVAVYAPALALSRVTGLHTYVAVTLVYVVCILYSSQGGMKAVIMTDTFQTCILLASIMSVLIIGAVKSGGPATIYDLSLNTQRLEFFNMNPSPTIRHSFWSVVLGGSFYWATMFCSNQASVQKYLSVQKISQARKALWISCFGLILIFGINFLTGLVLYGEYSGCDPLSHQDIESPDEILPMFVVRTLGYLHGIPGLFVAGIFAASLGTVAAAVNSLAAVSITDFIEAAFRINIPERKGASISKWLSFLFGVLSFALIFLVEQLGSVLELALSFNGITGGLTLGLFSLGILFPWANSKGALTGVTLSFCLISWMGIGTQIHQSHGLDTSIDKVTSIDNCTCTHNGTYIVENDVYEPPFWVYKISYLWYSAIGCLLTFLIGSVVSLLTGPTEFNSIQKDLISPPVYKILLNMPDFIKHKLNIVHEAKKDHFGDFREKSQKEEKGVDNPALSLELEA